MNTLHRAACAIAACLLFVATLPSCASSGSEGTWQTDEIGAPSQNVLWTCAGMALQKYGFPVGMGADPTTLVMTSGWKVSLQPLRGRGKREQAHIKFEPAGPKRWTMHVRVACEKNMDIKHPLEIASAEWKADPDDLEAANVIVQHIRALVGEPLEVKAAEKKKF